LWKLKNEMLMIIPAKQYKRQYDKYITKGGIPMRNKTPVFHSHTFLFFFFAGLFLFFSLHLGCGQKVYASSWKVTQHGSDSDFQQSMFYTIKGSNGKLIVIDGGWDYDAKRVRDTIKKLGGKVNLWIITHPHPDHVGAFNQIFANPDGIQIDQVIAPKINASRYRHYQYPWDEYQVFQKFSRLVRKNPKIRWAKADDTFSFAGLDFEFFNGYSRNLKDTTKDICNGSSLVFKISGKKTSMLFTGDIVSSIGKRLIKTYHKRLKATYLQAPHHGNNDKRESFFKYIHAKVTFIDAPSFLRKRDTVKRNIKVLKDLGEKVYTYNSRKRSVTIR